ncbi:release factor [Trametes punicea]|nr:release factor [Trametes punicea]
MLGSVYRRLSCGVFRARTYIPSISHRNPFAQTARKRGGSSQPHDLQARCASSEASKTSHASKGVALHIRAIIDNIEHNLRSLQDYVDFDQVQREIERTQASIEDPYLWTTDPGALSKAQTRLSELQFQLWTRNSLQSSFQLLKELSAVAQNAENTDLQSAALLELQGLLRTSEEYLRSLWLRDPVEENSAFIEVCATPAGDDKSCDWAAMLANMYTRWAHSRNYAVKVVDETPGDAVGIKTTTLLVDGRYAFGYAQYESGMHRLIRKSASHAKGAGQTSLASVRVLPYIEDDGSGTGIELHPAELDITTMDSQGIVCPQNVDDAHSAVRVTHIPTGVTVSCQREHSLEQNRTLALSLLKAKLYHIKSQDRKHCVADARSALNEESKGSEIRSYILQPIQVVKDLRTGYEVITTDAVQSVLKGDLTGFMEASLQKFKKRA